MVDVKMLMLTVAAQGGQTFRQPSMQVMTWRCAVPQARQQAHTASCIATARTAAAACVRACSSRGPPGCLYHKHWYATLAVNIMAHSLVHTSVSALQLSNIRYSRHDAHETVTKGVSKPQDLLALSVTADTAMVRHHIAVGRADLTHSCASADTR